MLGLVGCTAQTVPPPQTSRIEYLYTTPPAEPRVIHAHTTGEPDKSECIAKANRLRARREELVRVLVKWDDEHCTAVYSDEVLTYPDGTTKVRRKAGDYFMKCEGTRPNPFRGDEEMLTLLSYVQKNCPERLRPGY